MRRARKLLPRILAILREHKLPMELAALPMVESSYNPQVSSKAGAAGLWQFIRSTGKQYLTIKRKRDDRRDPIRATEAAAHLLRHNYEAAPGVAASTKSPAMGLSAARPGSLITKPAIQSSTQSSVLASHPPASDSRPHPCLASPSRDCQSKTRCPLWLFRDRDS